MPIEPDPAAFRLTLRRLHTRPEQAVFIDDTLEHVEAARNLGLHGIHFTTADALSRTLHGLLVLPQPL